MWLAVAYASKTIYGPFLEIFQMKKSLDSWGAIKGPCKQLTLMSILSPPIFKEKNEAGPDLAEAMDWEGVVFHKWEGEVGLWVGNAESMYVKG